MERLSIPFSFAVVFSLSLAASSSSTSSTRSLFFPFYSSLPLSPPPSYQATASDVLTLLGSKENASATVNPTTAGEIRSCFRFLVPFENTSFREDPFVRPRSVARERRLLRDHHGKSEENELIWWPPPPVLELARLAIDSGGDPDALHRTLDPTTINVPDVEGSKQHHCELTRTPYGWRFMNEELNSYLAFLFELIASRGPAVGLNVSLNRYDLFHGHLLIARDSGRLGILFHAKEYPAYDKSSFPYNMGYCQCGSTLAYDDSMNLRNILWLAPLPPPDSSGTWAVPGVLVILDAHPRGIIYRDLVPEYVQFARTLYEDDFGEVVADVNYLNVGGSSSPNFQIFIC